MNQGRVQIAIVEDDPTYLRALERLLQAGGFKPLGYSSAEDFLNELPELHADWVILDIRLGSLTGFDLARHIAGRNPQTPVIFITAHEDPKTKATAEKVGCVAYLLKPFSAQTLFAIIMHSSHMSNETAITYLSRAVHGILPPTSR